MDFANSIIEGIAEKRRIKAQTESEKLFWHREIAKKLQRQTDAIVTELDLAFDSLKQLGFDIKRSQFVGFFQVTLTRWILYKNENHVRQIYEVNTTIKHKALRSEEVKDSEHVVEIVLQYNHKFCVVPTVGEALRIIRHDIVEVES